MNLRHKIILYIFLFISFFFFQKFFIQNTCKKIIAIKSTKDFGINHLSNCINLNLRKNGLTSYIKNYPELYEFARIFQRKYISGFDLDQFKFDVKKIIKKDLILDEFKYSKGLINKNTDHSHALNNEKYLEKEINNWHRSHGGDWNLHFSSSSKINKNNISNLKLVWKYTSQIEKDLKKNFKKNVQVNPILFDKKLIVITSDWKVSALNAINGSVVWSKQSLHEPSRRGIVAHSGFLYLPIANKIYKIDINNGKIDKQFGKGGYVLSNTKVAPIIYENNLVVISGKSIETFNLINGNKISKISIHKNPNFSGGEIWGGAAIDKKKGIIYVTIGNPRPALYGVNRPGDNKNSSSIIAIDLKNNNIKWSFQDVNHDLWDYDISSPPLIHDLKIQDKSFEVVIALTKTGNILMLERNTGEPIFDIRYRKAPKSDVIGEVTSNYQIDLTKPENFSGVEYNKKSYDQLSKDKKDFIEGELKDKKYGWFEPPSFLKDLVVFGLHGGAQWTGAALDPFGQDIYIPTNNVPYILEISLQTKYLNIKKHLNKQELNIFDDYQNYCSSCHLSNRNGVSRVYGEKKIIDKPSLVGLTLIDKKNENNFLNLYEKFHKNEFKVDVNKLNNLFNKWDKILIDNELIRVKSEWSAFLTPDDLPASNPPWGYIAKLNLETGKLKWKKPVGKKKNSNIGTEIFGGAALNRNGILFVTGTDDNFVYALDAINGDILWEFKMKAAGSTAPIIYQIDDKEYVSIVSTGGNYFSYEGIDSTIYTFSIN